MNKKEFLKNWIYWVQKDGYPKLDKDFVKDLDQLLDNWISVNDELPENDNLCLLWCTDNCFYLGYFSYRDGSCRQFVEECMLEPTHWQPLPQPPRE